VSTIPRAATPRPRPARRRAPAALRALAFSAVAAGLLLAIAESGRTLAVHHLTRWSSWRQTGAIGSWLTGLFSVAWLLRALLWWRYKPLQLSPSEHCALPMLSLVIPAFNEGPMVRRSVESVLASQYPADRLRVIVVDDGSTDDTGAHIDAVAAAHPSRVEAVHLPCNRGKRHALYEGFRRATGDLVVTVDSDSIVPPGSLRQLVVPFMQDPSVGGVAGKVVVFNRWDNVLTRMLGVRFILGFDFVRAYQSKLGTVWCCPGALQAYRLAIIRPHLERWRDQRFLGANCTNGDDHAMTNLVLALGSRTVYQSNALVETIVPNTYVKLCKMYLRWGRSATREGLLALRFAGARALALDPVRGPLMLLDALLQPCTILLRLLGFGVSIGMLVTHPHLAMRGVPIVAGVSVLHAGVFLRSERSLQVVFGLLYSWFALFALSWIQPFATLTVRRNGWLTRTAARPKGPTEGLVAAV
jgi:hyaluronan synthase